MLPLTCEDTAGPYYPQHLADADPTDLTRVPGTVFEAEGARIVLEGTVTDIHGAPATGVLIELWQADAQGRTGPDRDPNFAGWGRQRVTGAFRFVTVRPGALPGRAPHVTLTLFSDGVARLVTQVFFSGAADPVLDAAGDRRDRLIARPTPDGFAIDIRLAGEDETPFFDDVM